MKIKNKNILSKLLILFIPFIIFATILPFFCQSSDEEPKECCTIRTKFNFKTPDGRENTANVGDCAAPTDAAARECNCPSGSRIWGLDTPGIWSVICILNTLYFVTKWLFYILTTISVFIIIIGAFLIITSGGDPDKWKKGKDVIIYALIGIGVALLSKVLPALVGYFLGV